MTYIEYLNQFHRWRENSNPGDKLIVLYLNMLDMFNQRYWPEWAGVTTQQLMVLANTDRKQTALDTRNALVRAGFIEYRPGRKGKATTYRLVAWSSTQEREAGLGNEFETENRTENRTENSTENSTENRTPIKIKTKTKTQTKNEGKSGGGAAATPPVRKKYGPYHHVPLSEQELAKLREKLGDVETKRCIFYIDEYVQIHGNRNGWKDFYLVCLKCSRERWGIRAGENPNNPVSDGQSGQARPKTLREQMEERRAREGENE